MNKRTPPLSVYSVRLDFQCVQALKQRARDRGLPVAMVIRSVIDDYLNDRDAADYLAEAEQRITAAIDRLNRTHLQTRRVVDISVALSEYMRRTLDLIYNDRPDGEEKRVMLIRRKNIFMNWLPEALSSRGDVRQMIWQVISPQQPSSPERDQSDESINEEESND